MTSYFVRTYRIGTPLVLLLGLVLSCYGATVSGAVAPPINCLTCIQGLCENATCAAVPDAECKFNDFCSRQLLNGQPVDVPNCTEYFVKDGKIVDCSPPPPSPPPVLCALCIYGICDRAKCPAVPDAECKFNACSNQLFNGKPVDVPVCTAYFVKNGKIVDCGEVMCNDPSGTLECFVNPCEVSTCAAYPDAKCIPSYCDGTYRGTDVGQCEAIYVDSDTGDVLDCDYGSDSPSWDAKLIGSWTLVKIKQQKGLLPFPGAKATITFTTEGLNKGTLGGNNGCNAYSGDYDVPKDGSIEIGPLISTKIACSGSKAKLEGLYAPLLAKVDGFKASDKQLKLFAGKGKVLVFKKDGY